MDNEEYFKKLNKQAQQKPEPGKKVKPPTVKKIYRPYSFGTFAGMSTWVTWGIFFYFLFWFTYGLITATNDLSVGLLFSLELAAAMWLVFMLAVLTGYLIFRGWVERLPFPLIGWTELIASHRMNKQKYYRLVTLEVVLKPGTSTEIISSVTDALKILNNKQNRWTNPNKFGDGRRQWNNINYLTTQGTANNTCMGRIKKSLQTEFTEIQRRTGCIEKIWIRFDQKDFTWEPPNTDTMS